MRGCLSATDKLIKGVSSRDYFIKGPRGAHESKWGGGGAAAHGGQSDFPFSGRMFRLHSISHS